MPILPMDLHRLTDDCRIIFDLNVEKCHITFTRNRRFVSHHRYHFNGASIPRVEIERDLGIMQDCKVFYTSHFDFVTRKSRRMLGFLHRSTKCYLQIQSLKILHFAYVRRVMEYVAPVWSYVTHISQLEAVQCCFTRRLKYRLNKYDSYSPFCKLDSPEDRRIISDLMFLFNVLILCSITLISLLALA